MVNSIYFNDKKNQLYELFLHCIKNVPYYREHLKGNLISQSEFSYDFFSSQIPILEKDTVRENSDLFISDTFEKNILEVDVTSGTEGKPMVCYKSKQERISCSNELWKKRRSWIKDLSPKDRFARFYAFRNSENNTLITNKVFQKGNDLHIPLFDMSENMLLYYWQKILEFKPRWIHGPTTAIFNIAKYVKDHNLQRYKIEFVELNGEYVTQEHINFISEVFGCKVANHYGCREFWALGFSCQEGTLHILDKKVFIESVFNSELNSNEILVTSLTNKAWPLIRYRLGDIGNVYISDDCCDKTKSKFCLNIKKGRRADYFTLKNNQIINAITFSGIARGINNVEGQSLIYQYQVIKKAESYLEIKLCVNKNSQKTEKYIVSRYNEELRKIIGEEIIIKYEIVNFIIPNKKTGKCRDFIDLSEKSK